ncbi:unnamed protein product [Moneuplotes crassus]|uniref:Uncharacterized protein n=1 Tax=Euplotes crassus TaxID=5936 RepID=A0AAD1Y8M5_EUPCR|nr:unnamed protein product [Moneuplotes crassus]
MLPPVNYTYREIKIGTERSPSYEDMSSKRLHRFQTEIKQTPTQRILSNNQRNLSGLRVQQSINAEYTHALDSDYHLPKEDDLYVCVDSDVTKPMNSVRKSHFPKIEKPRFGDASEMLSISDRRHKGNRSVQKTNKKIKLPTKFSNFSVLAKKNSHKHPSLEAARERKNKSVCHLMEQLKKGPTMKSNISKNSSQFTPGRNIQSKKTVPLNSRFNMIKNNSTVELPQSLASKRIFEKSVIFSDIEVYLSKIRKHGEIQMKTHGIFKLPIGKIHEPEGDFEAFPIRSVLNQCNEIILEQRYRQRRLQNHQVITIEFLDSKIENSIEDEKKTPFHYIYTTSGERVANFTSHRHENLLLLVHESKLQLAKKLRKYTQAELQKDKKLTMHPKNYRKEMQRVMAGFCQENLHQWKANMQKLISKENIEYNLKKNEESNIHIGSKVIKAAPLNSSPKALEQDYSQDSFENISSSDDQLDPRASSFVNKARNSKLKQKKINSRKQSILKRSSQGLVSALKSGNLSSQKMEAPHDKPFQSSSKDLVPDLNYKQIKKISRRYQIPVNRVYELITQYNGLVKISSDDLKYNPEDGTINSERSEGEEAKRALGIKPETLTKCTRLLADKHQDIIPKILKGVGVDIGSKDPRVDLRSFLNLNSILDFGTAHKSELIQFWTRILDPDNIMNVEKAQIVDFFEKLSKGRFTQDADDEFSYANDVWKFFEQNKVLSENSDKLDIHKLRDSLERGEIDIKIFGDIFKSGFNPSLNRENDSWSD